MTWVDPLSQPSSQILVCIELTNLFALESYSTVQLRHFLAGGDLCEGFAVALYSNPSHHTNAQWAINLGCRVPNLYYLLQESPCKPLLHGDGRCPAEKSVNVAVRRGQHNGQGFHPDILMHLNHPEQYLVVFLHHMKFLTKQLRISPYLSLSCTHTHQCTFPHDGGTHNIYQVVEKG